MKLNVLARHPNKNQTVDAQKGFTLIELIIVIVMVGILSTIAAPSVLGLIARGRLSSALNQVRGSIQEAQRTANKKSVACSITLSSTQITSTDGCLPTGIRTLDRGVTLNHNLDSTSPSPNKIFITYLGGVDSSQTKILNPGSSSVDSVLIILSSNDIPDKKCLLVTLGLGLIRSGKYVGSSGSLIPDQCIVDQL